MLNYGRKVTIFYVSYRFAKLKILFHPATRFFQKQKSKKKAERKKEGRVEKHVEPNFKVLFCGKAAMIGIDWRQTVM
jgi:hypothetical protein